MQTIYIFLAFFLGITFSKTLHNGDKIIKVHLPTKETWILVRSLLQEKLTSEQIDIWQEPNSRTKSVHIHIREGDYVEVKRVFDTNNIYFDITTEDIQRLITEESVQLLEKGNLDIVGTYARYHDIFDWMSNITTEYPEVASFENIGSSFEGRETGLIKIGGLLENSWKIWIDGGMHAREWISPASVVYIIDQVISGYINGNATIIKYLETFEFYIAPVTNPDGYEYCHTDDRLWRKNRHPNNGSRCVGVDLNRNWDFQWGGVNADSDPCSNLYMGPQPESEPEVQNIVNYILPEADSFIMYLSYHSWGQQFFTRWDYTADEVPEDHEELLDLAQRSVDAMIEQHGLFWEAGTAPELMYPFAGGSADWARGVANIKYPYLLELRDDGEYAFELPPDQIIPQGEEVWAGLVVILDEILSKWGGILPPAKNK